MASCLVIAGEKSGEEHAMSFFPELRSMVPDVDFYGVGGEELKSQGMDLLYHLKDFSSMGFSEVIGKIPFYFKALKRIEEEVVRRGTRVAILIDFQGFNMKLAKRLKKRGVKVLYYVAPQAWAWKAHRAKAIAETTQTLFAILPFEKKWFMDRGVTQVMSIPHPLMLTYKNDFMNIPAKPYGSWGNKVKVLLLPGSRKFEVHSLLPHFVEAVRLLREEINVEVHLVRVGHIDQGIFEYFKDDVDVWHESQDLVKAMKECHFAFAASGTVTLSTGLFELPTVVCYKGSLLNEFVFYNFINYSGAISLTNIIHEQMVFPELVQSQVGAHNINRLIKTWLKSESEYNKVKATLARTKNLLSGENFSIPEYMSRVINDWR